MLVRDPLLPCVASRYFKCKHNSRSRHRSAFTLANKRHHHVRSGHKSPQAGATGRCEVALPLGTPGAPEGIEPELASRVVVLEYKKNNQSLLFQTNGLEIINALFSARTWITSNPGALGALISYTYCSLL